MSRIKLQRFTLIFFLLTLAAASTTLSAHAQPYRYLDESGNIYWVDSLDAVPRRYRPQIVAQPTAISDAKLLKKKQKELEKEKKKKEKARKKKQRTSKVPKPRKQKADKNKEKIAAPLEQRSRKVEAAEQDQLESIPDNDEHRKLKKGSGKKNCSKCHDKK